MATKQPSSKQLLLTERNPYTSLNINQKRYVEARLQGLHPAAARRAIGINTSAANGMERNPKVLAALRYLIKESTKNVEELTKNDVLSGMMDAVNAAATAAELVMAWREVGKLLGAYEPERKILEIRDYTDNELKELPDKDLVRLAGGKMQDAVEAEFTEVPSSE